MAESQSLIGSRANALEARISQGADADAARVRALAKALQSGLLFRVQDSQEANASVLPGRLSAI
jgi:hypothetical protein